MILFFPCLTMALFYWAWQIWAEEGVSSIIIFFWASWAAYVSYVLFPLIGYISAKITYDKNSFKVEGKGKSSGRQYSWSDVSETKYHEFVGVLHLLDQNKKAIYIAHKITPGFNAFKDKVYQRNNI